MKKLILVSVIIIMVLRLIQPCLAEKKWGIGLGAHYKDSYSSYVASLRTGTGWTMLDANLDYCSPTDEISYALTPRISLLINILGSGIYAGVGIQETYTQWTSGAPEWSNLVYLLQAGWEIFHLGAVSLSLDAQYELPVSPLQTININPESITFGARLFLYF